jgi:NADH:ubiquinone oxidoreductase subunit K
MRVTNWDRWTRTKKCCILPLIILSIGFMGGMEKNGSVELGLLSITLMFSAVMLIRSIHEHEW